jgi:CheY-like chemotaxis protein
MTSEVNRILLVEDSQRDVDLILAALGECGLADDALVVRDGEQALDYLYRRGRFEGHAPGLPAVVLLDLKLPRLSGLDVLTQIKCHPELRMVPVVMLTSSREESDLSNSYLRGANAYMVKPVGYAQFAAAIRALGAFWAKVNEPPRRTIGRQMSRHA